MVEKGIKHNKELYYRKIINNLMWPGTKCIYSYHLKLINIQQSIIFYGNIISWCVCVKESHTHQNHSVLDHTSSLTLNWWTWWKGSLQLWNQTQTGDQNSPLVSIYTLPPSHTHLNLLTIPTLALWRVQNGVLLLLLVVTGEHVKHLSTGSNETGGKV